MKKLKVRIAQQDQSVISLYFKDSVHNRQLADYINRHESFAIKQREESTNAS